MQIVYNVNTLLRKVSALSIQRSWFSSLFNLQLSFQKWLQQACLDLLMPPVRLRSITQHLSLQLNLQSNQQLVTSRITPAIVMMAQILHLLQTSIQLIVSSAIAFPRASTQTSFTCQDRMA